MGHLYKFTLTVRKNYRNVSIISLLDSTLSLSLKLTITCKHFGIVKI